MSVKSQEAIDAAAGDFFARRESGEWTAEEAARLEAWLAASPLHRVAYLRLEHVWERAERLKALRTPNGVVPQPGNLLSPFFSRTASSPPLPRSCEGEGPGEGFRGIEENGAASPWRGAPQRKLAWGLAAGLVAAFALGSAWLVWPKAPIYRTPVGGLETVPLGDGSTVILNTDSTLRVALSARERHVTLERGEAFFQVAKDPSRPFVVQAGDKRVVAVGTQFSVRRDASDEDIQVVVTEGAVQVEGSGLTSGAARAVRVAASEVAHTGDAGVLVQKESASQTEEALSWRQGELVFHDATLADAIAEFNRYNRRPVVIEDPSVAALKVGGNFRANNVEAFVRLLERGYPIAVEQKDGEVLLRAR